ncbi:MAG TPA: ArsC family reductase [Burkholderiaceae bacterium]|jgi:Spx/MgsR family transcriptional regulator|nr:ArsC family reductase [Burkholderiaceae bacterium]
MANPLTLYGIPNCDTVKKARAWLADQGVAYDFHDFKKRGLDGALLEAWIAALGWEPLVNRQGSTWRKLAPEQQARVIDAAGATAALLANPSLVKRPVAAWPDGAVTVGLPALQERAKAGG